ncbi:MAG: hypothetical protein V1720_18380 [bacterium]
MKKGCFYSFIVMVTIIIATVFYIVQKYGNKIVDFGKSKVFEIAADDLKEELVKCKKDIYRDSLLTEFNSFISDVRKDTSESGFRWGLDVLQELSLKIEDKKVDSIDFNSFKKIISVK